MPSETSTRTVPLDGGLALLEYRPFTLTVEDGPDRGATRVFDERSVEIGKGGACDLVLTDATVSRHHALLEVSEEGYELRDLGSRNGTRIDGCRVGIASLRSGVVFEVGASRIRFDLQSETRRVEISGEARFGPLIGRSAAMRELFVTLAKAARGDATVLVIGDSGTGKELCAQAIHDESHRDGGPFEVFDCAAVPGHLFESALFGHERGAFTGAEARRPGAFERADGGTLFLDEVGELPPELQPKLLRVLDSHEFRTVGGSKPVRVDVRVVAATNRELSAMVDEGTFRADLYHRLAVVQVRVPPLRRRPDDVPLLVDHFLSRFRATGHRAPPPSQAALSRLETYTWPGNVRELRNFVERGVVLDEDLADLPFLGGPTPAPPSDAPPLPAEGPLPPYHDAKATMIDDWERAYCERLLDRHEGNVSGAAREAGMNRKSLMYLLSKHGIRKYAR